MAIVFFQSPQHDAALSRCVPEVLTRRGEVPRCSSTHPGTTNFRRPRWLDRILPQRFACWQHRVCPGNIAGNILNKRAQCFPSSTRVARTQLRGVLIDIPVLGLPLDIFPFSLPRCLIRSGLVWSLLRGLSFLTRLSMLSSSSLSRCMLRSWQHGVLSDFFDS